MLKSPCKDCKDRKLGCHSDKVCTHGYPEYVKQVDEVRKLKKLETEKAIYALKNNHRT